MFRKTKKLFLLNLIFSIVALIISVLCMSKGISYFGKEKTLVFSLLIDIGGYFGFYLMALVYIFPENLRGGILSFISSYIMMLPFSFGILWLKDKYLKRK